MSTQSPKASTPIGVVSIGGRLVDVGQHPEFQRVLFDLFNRVKALETTVAALEQAVDDLTP